MFSKIQRSFSPCYIAKDAPLVAQGLSVTPSEVASLTERGLSVSSNGHLSSSEGVPDPVLTLENCRGVDIADAWNASQTAKANLVKAHRRDKEYYD